VESGLATAEGSNPSEINMDQMVSVKIDGVTSQITIRDAVNGYATKQKMTEATTRASELQKQVDAFDTFKAQLQRDPQGTITGLAERFNVTSPGASDEDYSDDGVDPALAEVRNQLAEQQRKFDALQSQLATNAQTQEIEATMDRLQALHGDAFKKEDVLSYALSRNIDDVETAFKAWRFDEGPSNSSSDAPLDEVVQALGHVAPGAPKATPTPARGTVQAPTSARESIERAYAASGVNLDEFLASAF